MKSEQDLVRDIESLLQPLTLEDRLKWIAENFPNGQARFSSSLGMEDQVITEAIATLQLDIQIFTLETGRLFEETLDVLESTRRIYQIPIRVLFPDAQELEDLVATQGVLGFYESIENRKACCQVRKIHPLKRALKGAKVWITGLRREQSATREKQPLVEWDVDWQLIKVNPLLEWSWDAVQTRVREKNIPINRLHAKGYPSIGCAPCTRPVKPGQDLRSGRWWWEHNGSQECGIHLKKNG